MAGGSEQSTALRKQAMLKALLATFGVIKMAADQVGINRTTHYLWIDEDPEYKAAVAELKEVKKDFVESKLMSLINGGDVASTIFAAKTLLKDRGYVERVQLGLPTDGDFELTLNLKGNRSNDQEPGN